MAKITPVILVGGSGKRLWPVSRENMPKQFVPLVGDRSTFQQTLQRVDNREVFSRPVVATNEAYRFLVESQARDIGQEIDILLEPMRRDSGPAIAAAAVWCREQSAPAVLVLASDHLVVGKDEFVQACRDGLAALDAGGIVTFGVPPTEPKTDYGYIQCGPERIGGAHKVRAFIEKPDSQTALRYLTEGLLWNSGNFLFDPEVLLDELKHYEPAMDAAAHAAVSSARRQGSTIYLDPAAFAAAPAKSIDYAVMERTAKSWVVPARFGWSDLGTWDALREVDVLDDFGNATKGPVELDDVRTSYIRSDGPLTAVVGLEDVVVVAMHDAVLVGQRGSLPRLKSLVTRMADRNHAAATNHPMVHRPWGTFHDLDRGAFHRAKIIRVNPGAQLSLQSHRHRAEHWVVTRGVAKVVRGDETLTLDEGEHIYIPKGAIHRLSNSGSDALEVIEVQIGHYLEEDDIVRYEDLYDRPMTQLAAS